MENFGGRRRGSGGFRRRFNRFGDQPKPVKEGEIYDVEIIEVGSRGDGLAKVQNFVIFVPGTNKGDKVRVRITQVRGSSAVAEVVSGSGGETTQTTTEEPKEETEERVEIEESEEEPEEESEEEPEEEPEETEETQE